MHIDEEQNILEGSDHRMITVNFQIRDINNIKKAKWKINTFYTTKESDVQNYVKELSKLWDEKETATMNDKLTDMETTAEKCLKRTSKRKIGGDKDFKISEKIWMTDEIRAEMKKKELNRKKRYGKSEKHTKFLMMKWRRQKILVSRLIKEAKTRHEIELTKIIRNKDNRGKEMWANINRISGRNQKDDDIVEVYENGKKLDENQAQKKN